ncbi:hypothetical protein AHF37_01724 [Paragonimus kellicotti]|nr:hypothetical protein AHF37_01724 [Paragonimus kellicotti]
MLQCYNRQNTNVCTVRTQGKLLTLILLKRTGNKGRSLRCSIGSSELRLGPIEWRCKCLRSLGPNSILISMALICKFTLKKFVLNLGEFDYFKPRIAQLVQ